MPYRGPWQTNDYVAHRNHQSVTGVYWQFSYLVVAANEATAEADESTSPTHTELPDPTDVTFGHAFAGTTTDISQALFVLDTQSPFPGTGMPPQIDPATPVPPNVIDIEFESDSGWFADDQPMPVTVAGNPPTGSAGDTHTYDLRRLLSHYTADRVTGLATLTKVPSAAVASHPLIGSQALATGATGTLTGSTVGADSAGYVALLIHDHAEASGVFPPTRQTWDGIIVTASMPYRSPRYRWVYAFPPAQRQFPRDDGLAASTRRSWPQPTSTQFGQRRGTSATYQ